ncbi:hypothetical protein [Streptosporangium vulgare]|uniref:hypothetical protein n=1 Tax=Streptosporangium vulgare TaxID=46190 RepID=UPI0031D483C7
MIESAAAMAGLTGVAVVGVCADAGGGSQPFVVGIKVDQPVSAEAARRLLQRFRRRLAKYVAQGARLHRTTNIGFKEDHLGDRESSSSRASHAVIGDLLDHRRPQ